jgi:hypothetical protein
MTGGPPSHWRDSAMNLAWTVLAIAVMLYIAARLILAVLPVLTIASAVGCIGVVGRSIYQHWRSRW